MHPAPEVVLTRPASGAFAAQPDPRQRKPGDTNRDRYERIDRLGAGGMGVVWRARDTWLERDVALKTVPERDVHLEQRLDRECRVAVRIRSDGCIRVLDRGTLEDGRPFVVTELLHTPALDPDTDVATRIATLIEVCRAIGDAHRQGMVHRDLKPSNLGLRRTADGQPGHAVVFDWGLAKPIERTQDPGGADGWSERVIGPPLTMSGMVTGTVGYMAPEQLANGRARPESDVWSLAAMLHEVVTGRSPCTDGTHTLLAAISKGALEVEDPAFDALLRRALSLEPDDRPSDGHALAGAIEAIVTPVAAAGPRRRGRFGIGVLGLGVGAAAAGLGFALRPSPPAAPVDALHTVHIALGDALAARGRFEEARRHGLEADSLRSTPESRGLLTFPAAPEPQVDPLACETSQLIPHLAARTCQSGADVVVVRAGQTDRHRVEAEAIWPLQDGLVLLRDRDLVQVRTDGSERVLGNERGAHLVVDSLDGGLAYTTGPALRVLHGTDGDTGELKAPTHIDTLVATPNHTLVSAERAILAVDGSGLREVAQLSAQPAVAGAHVGARVVFVGLRGEVLELDATTLEVVDRYGLRGVDQVERAAIDRRRIVIGNDAGVQVFQSGEPELQLAIEPVDQLMWTTPSTVQALRDDALLTWSLDEAFSMLVPSRGSTTALVVQPDPKVAVQPPHSNDARVYKFDPERLLASEIPTARSTNGVVRSLPLPNFMVENEEAYRLDPNGVRTPLGVFPVLATITPDQAIGVRRWGRGFTVFTPDGDTVVTDAPQLRTVIPAANGEHALAVDGEGTVYALGLDASITAVGVEGIDEVLADGGAGLAVSRGSEVELVDAWTASCADTVTALAVSDSHVAVGTHSGHICIFEADGTLARRFRAHPERVNALGFWSGWVFSGSWAPGLRRWPIDSSWSTSASLGQ